MKLKKGFTLIELLVVIAIIAILSAIIFPVFAQVKMSAYRSGDMSNMNSIQSALQLYRQDQGGYPPELLGYVTQYAGGPNPIMGDMLPANQVVGALYPKRVTSLDTLRPALDRLGANVQFTTFTYGVWPNKLGNTTSQFPNAYQKYGPTDPSILGSPAVIRCFNPGGGYPPQDVTNWYYTISGYDIANVPNENPVPGSGTAGLTRNEIHYALFWSGYTVPTDPCNPQPGEMGSANDDPRQLGYSDPPDTTVVTWDSYFRDYSGGTLQAAMKDSVLFLGGNVKPYDSVAVDLGSWKITPP